MGGRKLLSCGGTTIWVVVAILGLVPYSVFAAVPAKRENAEGINGAVVSNGAPCAKIGGDILKADGSAADAAIATLLCEGVILPDSLGIGGGFVATIYNKTTGKVETLIARETAPAAANKDMFVGKGLITGATACAIPGEIRGYWELHKKYGRVEWKKLFEPTIKLCREGFKVTKYLAKSLRMYKKRVMSEPSMKKVFVKPNGKLYKENDMMTLPTFANTLERIANNGGDDFYNGTVAEDFIADIKEMGGSITAEDLANYAVRWEKPIVADITKGYTLYTVPLPASGVNLAFILRVVAPLYTRDNDKFNSQVLIEAFKHAYGQRSKLGDFEKDPEARAQILETYNNLQNETFIQEIRSKILEHKDKTAPDASYYGASFTVSHDHGTANMAVLGPHGDAITVTSTVNNHFGAKVISPRTGIILNDEMDDFSTPNHINNFGVPASPANYIRPGKTPMSSMCPSIILDKQGNVRMLVGGAGGTRITTSVAQAIIRYLFAGKTLYKSINEKRLHHQLAPMQVEIENKTLDKFQYLTEFGHKIYEQDRINGFIATTAIGVRDGVVKAQFDGRRKGSTSFVSVPVAA